MADQKCRVCKRKRTVIRGHEDRDVHPLCDDPDTWWWNPTTGTRITQGVPS